MVVVVVVVVVVVDVVVDEAPPPRPPGWPGLGQVVAPTSRPSSHPLDSRG